ncbi:MAG: theronine dehydrogenase-like Zn-dependent dehydrogenase, partial [Pseudonocardiales bacterium]|nr:theronine dehydrogenase-like Zn-dependent dehydrogenase [Pseudonocardiales bacterium]
MKALRWHGRQDVRLDDVPVPQDARPGQALIRVLACGICGTDVEEWRSGPVFIPTQPHPLTGRQAPITLGHEVVGIVEALGVREDHIEIGDVVAVDGLSGCGECRWCREDRIVLCEQLAAIGLMSDGGLAEYCVVPARGCFRLPPEIDSGSAALTETLAVGVRALRRGRLAAGERVVVTGAGAAGLLAAQAARALGASDVTIVEPERMRRGVAASLGLNAVEDAAEAPLGD